ncbi:MFS general substrate transporter [Terfezia boudieri ATCC MYA-4762]|uniref:MFS general substrate transporter n=2 Tax=Terfezia boudieri ATCC MYA-4762 TaxID=1051890 RepID=A0A3N4M0H2_9PEZI|nr:MFS general substrate transporter [Terfezia boudieri ATCC MYA-4762]
MTSPTSDPASVDEKRHENIVISDPDAYLSLEEREAIDKALVKKLDMRLIPWLCLLYLASFLDRTNIGNGKIEGLVDDLHMTQWQYNACLSIFFVSYSLFEPVSNVLLKRMRPKIYIPLIMVLWGLTMTFMGFVKNYSGLMAARWFLGLTEAGLFPGVTYYLSCWYRRREFGIRAAIFFSAAAVSGSFGGLLAAAIAKMDGIGGKRGWAWIFILEGIATALIGIASFWVVVDFPDNATFLNDDDRRRVITRLKEDQQASAGHEELKMTYMWDSLKDWKTYTGCLIYMGVDGSLYAFSLFLPSIIKELGYTSAKAQLLSVPPYAAACLLTIIIGWLADKYNKRGIFNIGTSLLGVLGFSILLGSRGIALRYVAVFLGALGIYPCIPNTLAWVSNNVEGVYKRGVTLGIVIGWGNLNGVMSSNVYRGKDAPHYTLGHAVILGYLTIGLLGGSILQWFLLRAENERRINGERDHWVQGLDLQQIEALGDKKYARST